VTASFPQTNRSLPNASSSSPVPKRQSLSQTTHSQDDSSGDKLDSVFTETSFLPAPFAEGADESKFMESSGVAFLGNSSIRLDPIELLSDDDHTSTDTTHGDDFSEVDESDSRRALVERDFELLYMPLRKGFCTFGGLRVLLLEDAWVSGDGSASDSVVKRDEELSPRTQARILEEWSVIGEVWVNAYPNSSDQLD
jgi:hypothetical protein